MEIIHAIHAKFSCPSCLLLHFLAETSSLELVSALYDPLCAIFHICLYLSTSILFLWTVVWSYRTPVNVVHPQLESFKQPVQPYKGTWCIARRLFMDVPKRGKNGPPGHRHRFFKSASSYKLRPCPRWKDRDLPSRCIYCAGSTQIVAVSIAETLGFTKLGKAKQLGAYSQAHEIAKSAQMSCLRIRVHTCLASRWTCLLLFPACRPLATE